MIDYSMGYSEDKIATCNYTSTKVAINYIKSINQKIIGYNRRIIAFNTGIGGANNLNWKTVENHKYLVKVLNYKQDVKQCYDLSF